MRYQIYNDGAHYNRSSSAADDASDPTRLTVWWGAGKDEVTVSLPRAASLDEVYEIEKLLFSESDNQSDMSDELKHVVMQAIDTCLDLHFARVGRAMGAPSGHAVVMTADGNVVAVRQK